MPCSGWLSASSKPRLVGPLVSTGLLVRVGIRSPATRRAIALAHPIGLALVLGIYGAEAAWTSGMMARAVFVVPSALRYLAPGGWETVTFLMTVVTVLTLAPLILGLTCAIVRPRRASGEPIDRLLGLYLAAELTLVVFLSYSNGGAWLNYAIQAVVLVSVLAGACARSSRGREPPRLAGNCGGPDHGGGRAHRHRISLRKGAESACRAGPDRWPDALRPGSRPAAPRLHFVSLPQYNRLFGRVHLVS